MALSAPMALVFQVFLLGAELPGIAHNQGTDSRRPGVSHGNARPACPSAATYLYTGTGCDSDPASYLDVILVSAPMLDQWCGIMNMAIRWRCRPFSQRRLAGHPEIHNERRLKTAVLTTIAGTHQATRLSPAVRAPWRALVRLLQTPPR
jgi:hypothetical protein